MKIGRYARESGFSLIELMVVVAILAILASIVLPSYNNHVRKTRRAAGAACAAAVAQRLERVYTTDLSYAAAPNIATLTASCDSDALRYYSLQRQVQARTYTVSAAPKGAQSGDSCGTLSINQLGVKSPSSPGCW